MLVLTRKIGEQIKIGNDVTITIVKLRNNQVRIGIEAPREVRVIRGELETRAAESASAKSSSKSAGKSSAGKSSAGKSTEKPQKSVQSSAPASSASSNRMTAYMDIEMTSEELKSLVSEPATQVQNPIVDGLMSAQEMIEQAHSHETRSTQADRTPESERNASTSNPNAPVKIISGKLRTKASQSKSAMRAPLSDFFSAT